MTLTEEGLLSDSLSVLLNCLTLNYRIIFRKNDLMLNYLQLEANKTKFKSGINDIDHICEGVNCCKKYVLRHKWFMCLIFNVF
jgi:hypothetical protein